MSKIKNNAIIIAIVIALVFGGGGFFAGMQYQKSQAPQRDQFGQGFGNGQGRRAGGVNGNFRPVAGQIISSDDKSITVQLQDGSSKIVFLSDKTQISKADQATKTDLKVGQRVAVFGSNNSDGSVTAQNIQLNPQQFRGISSSPSASPKNQ